MRSYDAHSLRSVGRALQTPFSLVLDAPEDRRRIDCHAVLRHLPGKRLVCAGIWQDRRAVIAKIFLDRTRGRRHFERERQGVAAIRAAKLPTPELLFQGVLDDGKTPLLLFARMENSDNLSDCLAKADHARTRRTLILPVVELVAAMHAAGLRQRDIHPGNFLVADGKVMVIDGDDVEAAARRRPLSRRRSLSNLALFFAQFDPPFDTLVPELLAAYARHRRWPQNAAMTDETLRRLQRWREWRRTRYLRKVRRSCSAFVARSTWRRFMACDRAWYAPERRVLLEDPDRFVATGHLLKDGNSATVAKVVVDAQTVVVKRYNIKNFQHALRRGLRPTRAMGSWLNAHRLRVAGVPTPRPLAVIEERWGWLRRRAFFITEFLPGETIDRLLGTNGSDPETRGSVLAQLETLLAQLAAARLSHGDFKATNFLFSSGRLYLVDLDGMRAHRRLASFKQAFRRDLKRLAMNWRDDPPMQRRIVALADRLMQSLA